MRSTSEISSKLRLSAAWYIHYKKLSQIIHTGCAIIVTGCFSCCVFQPALWVMVSTTGVFLGTRSYYFNAVKGFGSNPECNEISEMSFCSGPNYSIFCDQFCWFWQVNGPWQAIDQTSEMHSHLAREATVLWFMVPTLMILCAMTALTGTFLMLLSFKTTPEFPFFLRQHLERIPTADIRVLNNCNQFVSNVYRQTCFNPQNQVIWCFFLSAFFSHALLFGLSLSDTLNPSWIFIIGIALSYFIWFGMMIFWIHFPASCLLDGYVLNQDVTLQLAELGMEGIITRRAQTDSELDRVKNPINSSHPTLYQQQRFHTV